VEQSCGEDDKEETYREDLIFTLVSKETWPKMRMPVCAADRRTKDSPMIVLMPAILGSLSAFRVSRSLTVYVRRYCI
jgi:hypothetical protein